MAKMKRVEKAKRAVASKVAVLGAGSWGTALAHQLKKAGHDVWVWGRDTAVLAEIKENSLNSRYLPELSLSPGICSSTEIQEVLDGAGLVVFAVPSSATRGVAKQVKGFVKEGALVVSTAKGLESETAAPMSQVLSEVFGADTGLAVLSGPSFAVEVVQNKPTAVTIASREEAIADAAAEFFHYDNFRVYTSIDLLGVEYSGVLKNVIAVAAGIVDGLEAGTNARAALVTRGLAEMQRLVDKLGGDPMTVVGLSGLGDLLLTSTGDLSRNRRVGLALGQGEKLEDIVARLGQVAEAVKTTVIVQDLAKKLGVQMPIVDEVQLVLSGQETASGSAQRLLARARRKEHKKAGS